MKYHCTPETSLVDLIGRDGMSGFDYGPLASSMKSGEDLELENSSALPVLMRAKIQALLRGLFIVETEETLRVQPGFRLLMC